MQPILIFDFDGVIVDGILEYWTSSRNAFLELYKGTKPIHDLPIKIPQEFRELRPWVKDGWEMVLIAAELARKNSSLSIKGTKYFAEKYHQNCHEALKIWGWSSEKLQITLDNVRKQSIKANKRKWLESHVVFPGIKEIIKQLAKENIDFGVLTTKSARFTSELLNHLKLHPKILYGYEAGSKPSLLLKISKDQPIKGFIEDRRATLEGVLKTPGIDFVPCYLASWGYLKPNDIDNLPPNIHLLQPKNLMSPLANWP